MDRNFAMEFVRVTEMAALASARLMGRGDEKAADHEAVEAMRKMLGSIQFDGKVVTTFRGIPIRTCDAILNNEARVV